MNTLSNAKINILVDCHVFDGKFQGTKNLMLLEERRAA